MAVMIGPGGTSVVTGLGSIPKSLSDYYYLTERSCSGPFGVSLCRSATEPDAMPTTSRERGPRHFWTVSVNDAAPCDDNADACLIVEL